MKDYIHYAIEAVLTVAIIILFVLNSSGSKKPATSKKAVTSEETKETMPVAYIDVDSLIANYTYSIDLNEQIIKKYENARANYTESVRKLQAEVADFQRKIETNSFLSQERAESEKRRLIKKQEDLQKLDAQLSQELGQEQQKMTEDLRKTIITQLREFNKDKGYQIVYGKMNDNILYADDAYNITSEVITYLNNQHASPTVKKDE